MHRWDERRRLRVVDAHEARRDRHRRIGARQLDLADDVENPARQRLHRESLRLEHRVQGQVPRLILDLGRDVALDVLAQDDGAAAESREARDDVFDAGVVPLHRDPGRLRLQRVGAMHGEILLDRHRPAERRRGHARGLLGTAGDRRGDLTP